MAIVKTKNLIRPGQKLVSSRGDIVDVTAERIRHWADKTNQLISAGNPLSVPWGHSLEASPGHRAKLNAGDMRKAIVNDDGSLDFVIDAPGVELEDGRLVAIAKLANGVPVKTAIREVSPGLWPSWTDGNGVKHDDVIGHLALVTHPVISGQSGFEPAIDSHGPAPQFLSTNTEAVFMATDSDDLAESLKDVAADDAAGDGTDADLGEDSMENIPDVPSEDEQRLGRVMAGLIKNGLVLPEDTNAQNFIERLDVALSVANGIADKDKAEVEPDADDDKPKPPVKEEQPPSTTMPTMLSTLIESPSMAPVAKRLRTERELWRKTMVAKLGKRGLKADDATRILNQPVMLSTFIQDDGRLSDDETDRLLRSLDRMLPPQSMIDATYLSTITAGGTVKEAESPSGANDVVESLGNGINLTRAAKKRLDEQVALQNAGKV